MAMRVKAQISVWLEMDIQTNSEDDATEKIEEAIKNESDDIFWRSFEVDDFDVLEVYDDGPTIDPYDAMRDRELDLIWTQQANG